MIDFERKTEEIFSEISTNWRGSEMLFPIKNKHGEQVNVSFYRDDTREKIKERLILWYENEMKMTPIEI